jgi:hypothetical protein
MTSPGTDAHAGTSETNRRKRMVTQSGAGDGSSLMSVVGAAAVQSVPPARLLLTSWLSAVQADVERGRRMGQRANRKKVHPGGRNLVGPP